MRFAVCLLTLLLTSPAQAGPDRLDTGPPVAADPAIGALRAKLAQRRVVVENALAYPSPGQRWRDKIPQSTQGVQAIPGLPGNVIYIGACRAAFEMLASKKLPPVSQRHRMLAACADQDHLPDLAAVHELAVVMAGSRDAGFGPALTALVKHAASSSETSDLAAMMAWLPLDKVPRSVRGELSGLHAQWAVDRQGGRASKAVWADLGKVRVGLPLVRAWTLSAELALAKGDQRTGSDRLNRTLNAVVPTRSEAEAADVALLRQRAGLSLAHMLRLAGKPEDMLTYCVGFTDAPLQDDLDGCLTWSDLAAGTWKRARKRMKLRLELEASWDHERELQQPLLEAARCKTDRAIDRLSAFADKWAGKRDNVRKALDPWAVQGRTKKLGDPWRALRSGGSALPRPLLDRALVDPRLRSLSRRIEAIEGQKQHLATLGWPPQLEKHGLAALDAQRARLEQLAGAVLLEVAAAELDHLDRRVRLARQLVDVKLAGTGKWLVAACDAEAGD